MENNSCSFFSLQHEDDEFFNIPFPEFSTIWNFGVDYDLGYEKEKKFKKNLEEINVQAGSHENQNQAQKKIIHRETERQRRQEMATLYASLRAVLPPQHQKGKRSISDQIHEATIYIGCMQNNIKELKIKREYTKRSWKNEYLQDPKKEGSSSKILPIVVKVEPCSIGVEIMISGDFVAEGLNILPLSGILKLLLQEGLSVVCCNCTEFDGKLHYMIQAEVLDLAGVKLEMLQKKLTCMISTMIYIKQ